MSRGMPTFLTPIVVIACLVVIFFGMALIASQFAAPSGGQIRHVCMAHDGVASLALPAIVANPVVVCRDGYAGYAE